MVAKIPTSTRKSKEMLKPTQNGDTNASLTNVVNDVVSPAQADLDRYFSSAIAVTTFLFIPLAPRNPLPQDPAPDELTLLPLFDLAALRSSYANHNLRVATLFTRLEQADVWSRGVTCCSYSQGLRNRIQNSNGEEAGVCTNLKLVFEGWTEAEVRGVIGESGTGWCALEEVWHDQVLKDSKAQSDSSEESGLSRANSPIISEGLGFDPSQSFVMPKLAFSSNFIDSQLSFSSSRSSSYSDLSDFVT